MYGTWICALLLLSSSRGELRGRLAALTHWGEGGGGGGGNDGRIDIREGADSGRGRGGGGISQSRDPGRVICFVHVNQL